LGVIFYFAPMYPSYSDIIVLVIGIPLLVAAFFVRRTYKN